MNLNSKGGSSSEGFGGDGFEEEGKASKVVVVVKEVNDAFSGRWTRTM